MPNPPFVSPVFQVSGTKLQYKPHVDYATWIDVWDIAALIPDVTAAIKARLPDEFSLFSDEFIWTTGTKLYAVSTALPYNRIAYSTTNGAVAEHSFIARSGTYTIAVLAQKATSSGIIDMSLDGNQIVSNLDLYAAAPVDVFLHTITGVTMNNNGDHKIVFAVDGHNASSSGYYTGINKIWGYRTGA